MTKLLSSMLFSVIFVVNFLSKFAFSAPSRKIMDKERFPCCPGSQQVTALMSDYVAPFTFSVENYAPQELCAILIEDVEGMKHDLRSMINCSKGGGSRIVDAIEAQLAKSAQTQTAADACAYSFSFIRAMFSVAAKATAHVGSTKWDSVTESFEKQIGVIDGICQELKIDVNRAVKFRDPFRGIFAHDEVPPPGQVTNNPAKQSAYRKKVETENVEK